MIQTQSLFLSQSNPECWHLCKALSAEDFKCHYCRGVWLSFCAILHHLFAPLTTSKILSFHNCYTFLFQKLKDYMCSHWVWSTGIVLPLNAPVYPWEDKILIHICSLLIVFKPWRLAKNPVHSCGCFLILLLICWVWAGWWERTGYMRSYML